MLAQLTKVWRRRQFTGRERRGDAVGVQVTEGRFVLDLKAKVNEGGPWHLGLLLHCSCRLFLLSSLLRCKPTLCILCKTVLLLFLLLLQYDRCIQCFSAQGLCFCLNLCANIKKKPYLFLYAVVLVNRILVLGTGDAKQRGQLLSHVVTHCRKPVSINIHFRKWGVVQIQH